MIKLLKNKKLMFIIAAAVVVIVVAVILLVNLNKGHRVITVTTYEGTVDLLRLNKNIEISEGLNLASKDHISVGEESMLEMGIDSDKHVVAQENTELEIIAKGNEKKGLIDIKLLAGAALVTIDEKLPEGSNFQVSTPNATLSVRGTTFNASYEEDSDTTFLNVSEGVVHVQAGDNERDVNPGESVMIHDDQIKDALWLGFQVEYQFADNDPDYLNTGRLTDISLNIDSIGYAHCYITPQLNFETRTENIPENFGDTQKLINDIYDRFNSVPTEKLSELFAEMCNGNNSPSVDYFNAVENIYVTDSAGNEVAIPIKLYDVIPGGDYKEVNFYTPTYILDGVEYHYIGIVVRYDIGFLYTDDIFNYYGYDKDALIAKTDKNESEYGDELEEKINPIPFKPTDETLYCVYDPDELNYRLLFKKPEGWTCTNQGAWITLENEEYGYINIGWSFETYTESVTDERTVKIIGEQLMWISDDDRDVLEQVIETTKADGTVYHDAGYFYKYNDMYLGVYINSDKFTESERYYLTELFKSEFMTFE